MLLLALFGCPSVDDSSTDPACEVLDGFVDEDGDGFGVAGRPVRGCVGDAGFSLLGTDCADQDAAVNPGAGERCDGADDDCNDKIDDDATDAYVYYTDADGDGYGGTTTRRATCTPIEGGLEVGGDCDDADASANPVATELCNGRDDDCDDTTDEADAVDAPSWYLDADGDGYGVGAATATQCTAPARSAANPDDCDDDNAGISPGAPETCDGEDDDCDGLIDDPEDATDATIAWPDADGDGFGAADASVPYCEVPVGWLQNGDDCDDANPDNNPDGIEFCDGVDNDCNERIDEASAADATAWHPDADADGFGDLYSATDACDAPSGWLEDDSDCDDGDDAVNPDATESCNLVDDDCDTDIDEDDAVDALSWYEDTDGDGYGDASVVTAACTQPAGYAASDTDCDDTDADTSPGSDEVCGGLDENCDGEVDEDGAVDVIEWFVDIDGDGYGVTGVSELDCDAPSGYADNDGDCDDADAQLSPGADELCNLVDDDCDGDTDEDDAVDATTWYLDADGDGYGVRISTDVSCTQPAGYAANAGDCGASDATIFPGAEEVCNDRLDNNCDSGPGDCELLGAVDETEADLNYSGPAAESMLTALFASDLDGDGDVELVFDGAEGQLSLAGGSTTSGYAALANLTGATDSVSWNAAGDLDGDGVDDFTGTGDSFTGTGVFYGPISTSTAASDAVATIFDSPSNDEPKVRQLGGDIDGDGNAELIVADENYAADLGAVAIFESATGSMAYDDATWLVVGAGGTWLGAAAIAVDVDGDGTDELVASSETMVNPGGDSGTVWVFAALSTGTTTTASAWDTIFGSTGSGQSGTCLAAAGDNDGDGYLDVAVGSDFDNGGGRMGSLAVYAGSAAGIGSGEPTTLAAAYIRGPVTTTAGWAIDIAANGDLDADGSPDVAVMTNSYFDGGTGGVWMWYGPLAGTSDESGADFILTQSNVDQMLATDVLFADQNDDGYDDLIVTSSWASTVTSATYEGSTWVFWGGTG